MYQVDRIRELVTGAFASMEVEPVPTFTVNAISDGTLFMVNVLIAMDTNRTIEYIHQQVSRAIRGVGYAVSVRCDIDQGKPCDDSVIAGASRLERLWQSHRRDEMYLVEHVRNLVTRCFEALAVEPVPTVDILSICDGTRFMIDIAVAADANRRMEVVQLAVQTAMEAAGYDACVTSRIEGVKPRVQGQIEIYADLGQRIAGLQDTVAVLVTKVEELHQEDIKHLEGNRKQWTDAIERAIYHAKKSGEPADQMAVLLNRLRDI